MSTSVHVSLGLEPQWHLVNNGDKVDFLSELVWHGGTTNKHLVRSAVGRNFVVVLGDLPEQASISILDGIFSKASTGLQVIIDNSTSVLGHPVTSWEHHFQMIETCSGIGCMSDGINAAGITIKAKNDISEPFCQFQTRQGYHHMILGDIGCNQTIAKLHAKAPHATWLAAGFSCQPWSRFGDQKKMSDPRSKTLQSVLRCAYFLRCHSIILECVQAAGTDPEVQKLLNEWCRLTGFHQSTVDLSLQHLWPATRDRWWCILSYGGLPRPKLDPFPRFPRLPRVGDLLPNFLQLSNDESQDLRLDLYETNKYIECGGLEQNMVSLDNCLPTALHGWANQLTGCPCQCRKQPLSYDRLIKKGLHGVLIPTEGHIESALGQIPQLRHIHPWELALCNGVEPNRHWQPHRLSLCGLGQLASPIQCLWVLAQWKWHFCEWFDCREAKFPEQLLWEYMTKLFTIRDELYMCSALEPRQRFFVRDLHAVLGGSVQSKLSVGSLQVTPVYCDQNNIAIEYRSLVDNTSQDESQVVEITSSFEIIEDGEPLGTENAVPIKDYDLPTLDELDTILANQKGKGGNIPRKKQANYGQEKVDGSFDVDADIGPPLIEGNKTIEPVEPRGIKRAIGEVQDLKLPFYSESGGVPGFSTSVATQHSEPPPVPATATEPPLSEEDEIGLTQAIHQRAIEVSEDNEAFVTVRIFTPDSFVPAHSRISHKDIIGSVAVAEHRLQSIDLPITSTRIDSILGLPISPSQKPGPMKSLFVADISTKPKPVSKPEIAIPATRLAVLHQQGPWVAVDEMKFYCGLIHQQGFGQALAPIVLESDMPDELEVLGINHTLSSLSHHSPPKNFFTAILIGDHWVPVVFIASNRGFEIHSTQEGIVVLNKATTESPIREKICFHHVVVPSIFDADCGFQALGCILGLLGTFIEPSQTSAYHLPHSETAAFSQHDAESWRVLFEHHLLHTGLASHNVVQALRIGGVGKDDIHMQVSHLLSEHGVPVDQVESRTNMVIDKIGRSLIAKAFRTSKPWAEIKGLANNATPKIQLVLPSELQAVIQHRLSDPTPFGDRKVKQTKQGKQPKQPLRLLARDLEITNGLFKQGDDTPIAQIQPDAIGPDAQGVVLMNACDAYSYLKLTAPISKAGLAILVLEQHDPALQGIGELVRFPARCVPTGEPIILTVKLVQAGSIYVSRHCPSKQLVVDEVPTSVVRAVVFRDECDIPWQQFLDHPVRHIVNQNPSLQDSGQDTENQSLLLDVWDRQTLTKKFGKVKKEDADMFIVCLRVAIDDPRTILQHSGKQGIYYEPRSNDGRTPSDQYHVVWLNKVSKSDAMTSQQVATIWTSVVRHGDRFGLRTTRDLAPQLHEHHKPNSPFLSGQSVNKFLVGPFPFGATRIGILKIFKSWQWNARPNQPRGRSIDGKGVLWECQAPCKPEYEVYHLAHADVLITELPSKKGEARPPSDILASSRTIAALKQSQSQQSVDPWFAGEDPWAAYQPHSKAPRTQAPHNPQSQLAVLGANLEKQITAQVIQQVEQKLGSEDVTMGSSMDNKVQLLEQKINQVEKSLQEQTLQQNQMNQKTSTQLTSLQQQIDHQSQSFQQHLDSRMQDQMSQIEKLLTQTFHNRDGDHKKPRQE